MTKKFLFVAFVAVLAFSACHKDPTPTPEPQTVIRLASEENVFPSGIMTMNTNVHYVWENGVLMSETDSIILPIMTTVYHNQMSYENGNLTKIVEEDGKWQYTFTYDDGLLKTFLNIMEADSMCWGNVTAYNADGNVEEIMSYDQFKTIKWTLTWENGDVVKVMEDILEPAEQAGTNVYTYTYDDKTSVYTGIPLAKAMLDGDGKAVAKYMSKHNRVEEGVTYEYDEKGMMTSAVSEEQSSFYHYIEQTIE